MSCLIFIHLYFLLAKPADTNFNLLVEDEEDYQVDYDDGVEDMAITGVGLMMMTLKKVNMMMIQITILVKLV